MVQTVRCQSERWLQTQLEDIPRGRQLKRKGHYKARVECSNEIDLNDARLKTRHNKRTKEGRPLPFRHFHPAPVDKRQRIGDFAALHSGQAWIVCLMLVACAESNEFCKGAGQGVQECDIS